MEQDMIDGLQNLCLTKEEEEGIPITTRSKPDLLEECSLSLFGRLLSDRQQNQRALKSILRSAWKMGLELKIVNVGNSILQFKFNSRYQMEWVENSGPWNFENNLLLLYRWKKGLSTTNMVFTHSPFWVQLWGLPFEHMSEEVGRDVGNNLGRFIEMDKRACQLDQALFMRIRVKLSIDKLLRKRGNVGTQADKEALTEIGVMRKMKTSPKEMARQQIGTSPFDEADGGGDNAGIDNGVRWDELEKVDQLLRLGSGQCEDMTAHNSEINIGVGVEKDMHDAFSKVGFPLHEAENSHEVTSPHKPKKEFQVGVMVEEHKST
nr:uncharacterized protein CFP56_73340 [Quercus suber]